MWQKVITATIEYYQKKISELSDQIDKTRDNAAKAPGAMQSWSDKSKDELTHLANSMSSNLNPLQSSLKILNGLSPSRSDKVLVGSIIKIDDGNTVNDEYMLIVPDAGGDQIEVDENKYFLLSENSELGKSLVGKKLHDKLILKSGLSIEIIEIVNR